MARAESSVHNYTSAYATTQHSCHTECLSLEGPSRECPVRAPTPSRMLRAMSSQVLSISKGGDSTSPLGNLCQTLTTLPLQRVSSYFYVELCPASSHQAPPSRVWLCCLYSLPHQVFMHVDKSFHQDELSQLSQSFLMGSGPLITFRALFWTQSMYVPVSRAGESNAGHSSPGKAASATSRREASPPSACWQCLLTLS